MERKYALKMTHAAQKDIDGVLRYISANLANPTAAVDLLDEIERKTQEIRVFPYAYPDCRNYFLTEKEYRHVLVGNYAVFFYVREEHRVEVLRFLYTHMDFSKEIIKE